MKRFRKLINEFRRSFNNTNNPNSGGDYGEGDYHKYMYRKVRQFMERIPFNHKTPEGHELHFHDTLNALRRISDSSGIHYAGYRHSIENPEHHNIMKPYFENSTQTHDGMIEGIEHYVLNHKELPEHYVDFVPGAIHEITKEHEVPTTSVKSAKYAIQSHLPPQGSVQHPHISDTAHHLKLVIDGLNDNPDEGYFIRKEETQ